MAINLAQCAAPARIQGRAAAAITFREQRTGKTMRLGPGYFDRAFTPGSYSASCSGFEWKLDLVGGRMYELSFDPEQAVTLALEASCTGRNVTVRAKPRGKGAHVNEVKLFNLAGAETKRQVVLKAGEDLDLQWRLRAVDSSTRWIVVAIPDSAYDLRKEVFGRVNVYTKLS